MDCTTKTTLTPIEMAIAAHQAAREKEANARIIQMARMADQRKAAQGVLAHDTEALLCALFGRSYICLYGASFALREYDEDGEWGERDGTTPNEWAVSFRWGDMDFCREGFHALTVKDGRGEYRDASSLEAIGAALAGQHSVILDMAA